MMNKTDKTDKILDVQFTLIDNRDKLLDVQSTLIDIADGDIPETVLDNLSEIYEKLDTCIGIYKGILEGGTNHADS